MVIFLRAVGNGRPGILNFKPKQPSPRLDSAMFGECHARITAVDAPDYTIHTHTHTIHTPHTHMAWEQQEGEVVCGTREGGRSWPVAGGDSAETAGRHLARGELSTGLGRWHGDGAVWCQVHDGGEEGPQWWSSPKKALSQEDLSRKVGHRGHQCGRHTCGTAMRWHATRGADCGGDGRWRGLAG